MRIHTSLDNEIRDHKLIVNFPSCVPDADWADCESAWDVAHRTINHRDTKDNFDKFLPFQPMQNFVDVSDGKIGLAVLTKGLREYEVDDDADRTIKITLIRTQRAYMTANGKMTYEELDRYTGQHSFGKMTYDICLYPHQGDFEQAHVWNEAYAAKVPLKAIQGVATEGKLPVSASFFTFSQEGKILTSALKQSEDGTGLTLRVYNTTDETLPLTISTILPIKQVVRTRLDESPIETLSVDDNAWTIELCGKKIETFVLKLK